MENNFDDFSLFVHDIQNPEQEPKTIEEIARARGITGDFAVQQCERLRKDAAKPTPVDPFAVEEVIAQTRILKAISEPTQAGQVFNRGSAIPLSKGAEPEPQHDELLYLLGSEVADPPLPRFESLSDSGRVTIAPGPSFAKRAGGGGRSFLDQELSAVFSHVAAGMPNGPAREFCKSLSVRAAEMEGA